MKTHLQKQLRRQYAADCNIICRSLLIAFIILIYSFVADASCNIDTANGAIRVLLKDKANQEAIPFANIVAYQNGVQVAVGTSDMDGLCIIKHLTPGKYDVKGIYVGYEAQMIKGVVVGKCKTVDITLNLSGGIVCFDCCCCCFGCGNYPGIDWWHVMWTPYRDWYNKWKEKKAAKHNKPTELLPYVPPMIKEDTVKETETIVSADTLANAKLIAAENLNNEVNIYPNPCYDILHIDVVNKIQILNAEGKVLREENANNEAVEIKVSDLAKGMYYLNYEKEGKRGTKKVVVAGN